MPAIPGCDRASLPEVALDYADVKGMNLACAGAETSTTSNGAVFKPGIDFYAEDGRLGQAEALRRFAEDHDVTTVVLSIGGNDFNFSAILTRCVEDFVATSPGPATYCSKDPELASYFTADRQADVQERIEGAIANIRTAMDDAGRGSSSYRIVVQNYPSPIPPGHEIRYAQTAAGRFARGGCPMFDRDATWANTTALAIINRTVARAVAASGLPDITLLDLSRAFVGHRLCEQGAAQIEGTGLRSWRADGAADRLEWVNQIYLKGGPWQIQESAHPNYWGTAAERNCLRQVVRRAASPAVSCTRAGRAMTGREPRMTLTPLVIHQPARG